MAKKLVGHMSCPECDFADAEVGEDKNGHPYRHCPECHGQFFTHGDPVKVANMKKKMRPLAAPKETATTEPAPKKKSAIDELLSK